MTVDLERRKQVMQSLMVMHANHQPGLESIRVNFTPAELKQIGAHEANGKWWFTHRWHDEGRKEKTFELVVQK